ncbi:hypothetical protein [Clavibacter zhangzhiyongii]|uniref:hypothetical protein n=1 Tax=Clavibacter zhangzhiyongii TaxID=2768071 RepID=UPI0039E1B5C5
MTDVNDADPWMSRLSVMQDLIYSADNISLEARESVSTVVQRVTEIHTNYPFLITRFNDLPGFWEEVEATFEDLPIVLRDGSAAAHDWAKRILFILQEAVQRAVMFGDASYEELGRITERRIAGDIQSVATSQTADKVAARGEEILEDLSTYEEIARKSSGRVGGEGLATYFRTYAGEQKLAADAFRILTLGLIGLAAVLAFSLPHDPADGWTGAIARVSVVAAVGGLAAYTGRQSGQHRKLADWARTLQVQLLSLEAFIGPIDDQQSRNDIYSAFARRVLGAPPAGSKNESDPPEINSSQIIDIISAFARKA